MEEVCGKITIRGNKCFNQKSKCRYHQVLKRKFYSPSMNSNFANRAICGVETTGNSQSGDPCQNPLQKGEEYCACGCGAYDTDRCGLATCPHGDFCKELAKQ